MADKKDGKKNNVKTKPINNTTKQTKPRIRT